jgi:TetR/AcrR family transcriptional regulator, copper-responsive repressor
MATAGRPRTFDRDAALAQAMLLFWKHGYESTSLSVLKAGMGGITAPSFYAAFKSKEALFAEVVDLYLMTHGRVTAPLWDDDLAPRQAVERTLRGSARMQTGRGHPRGCLLVLAASTCSPANEHVQQLLAEQRARVRKGFQQRVRQAIDIGDLSAETDVRAYAATLHGCLMGMSTEARDGVAAATLDTSIDYLMLGWDRLAAVSGLPA